MRSRGVRRRRDVVTALLVAIPAIMAVDPARSEDDLRNIAPVLTAAFTATTDYVSRGLSQTDSGPALQTTIETYYPASPVFQPMVGVFASTIRFTGSNWEVDPYAGARGEIAGFQYQAVVIYYAYPDARPSRKYPFHEFGLSVSRPLSFVTPTLGILYSHDFFADSGEEIYPFAEAKVPFKLFRRDWAVTGKFARRMIEHNDRFFLPDYNTWQVALDTQVLGLELSLYYVDTNIRDEQCPTEICSARVAFQVTKRF